MSVLSRNTGGGRRRLATTAAVFAGTLLSYLVLTAIPAMADTTCVVGAAGAGSVNIQTDPDDRITLFGTSAAGYAVLEDGDAAPTPCPAGATSWVNIVGSSAGQETVVLFANTTLSPGSFVGTAITADLGNGTDSVVIEYGDSTWNSTPVATTLPDSGAADAVGLGAGGTGTVVNTNLGVDLIGNALLTNIENITVNGGGGGDIIDAGNFFDITAFSAFPDPITADNIPATTSPMSANITANGEPGTDYFFSGNGNDTFNGGPDADTADFSTSASGVTVDLGAGTGTGQGSDVLTDVQGVVGSPFADTLTGSSINNTIIGGAGPDTIDGAAGDDIETGGAGDDTFNQGAAANGADTLDGSIGDCFGGGDPTEVNGDTLNYGLRTTNTVVRPGGGAVSGQDANADGDAADAGDERDTVLPTMENIVTGSGIDTIVGSAGNCEFMTPGAGNDTVNGGGAVGGDGFDFDVLDESDQTGPSVMDISNLGSDIGPAGNATATLGTQVDTATHIEGYSGTEEDDTLIWNGVALVAPPGGGPLHAQFSFRGYGGVDTVDASTATRGVTLDLDLLRPGATDDLENAIGGSGGDSLQGNTLNNELTGGDGADVIDGEGGADRVEGGAGNDNMTGGVGGDTLVYRNAPAGVQVDTQLGFATGGDGDDSATFFENVLGSDFDDTITAGQTSVDLNNRLKGFAGDDILTASNSSDTVAGGAGDDQLRMGGGDDVGKGAGGNDLILAGNGNDILNGGGGNDTGNGQKGFDDCNSIEDRTACEA